MLIPHKVQLIEQLFDRIDLEISQFQKSTGLHCLSGCGKCCTYPTVEASVLEFLPLAYHWFQEGAALTMLEKFSSSSSSICEVYFALSVDEPAMGKCSQYQHRGLICRLFGYGANNDKYGQLRLVTCSLIKNQQDASYAAAEEKISNGEAIPIFSDYYKKLMQIDFQLGNRILPINQAIKEALHAVLQYYSYRPYPTKIAG